MLIGAILTIMLTIGLLATGDYELNMPMAVAVVVLYGIAALIRFIIDPNNTPLHEAAYEGEYDVVRTLIAAGADVNAKDDKGKTPLDF